MFWAFASCACAVASWARAWLTSLADGPAADCSAATSVASTWARLAWPWATSVVLGWRSASSAFSAAWYWDSALTYACNAADGSALVPSALATA